MGEHGSHENDDYTLDRFYTNAGAVDKCLSVLDLDRYDLVIEPSAGSGAFSSRLLGCLAYDIAPAAEDIEARDWMDVEEGELPSHDRLLVVGNPPFGKRSALAKDFIRHAVGIGADAIAFVLPDTFRKRTNQRMFSGEWRLVDVVPFDEEDCVFDSPFDREANDGKVRIPCSFFVWTKEKDLKSGVDLRDILCPQPQDYSFVPRTSPEDADFCVNGNSGKVKDVLDVTNPKAEHYIKVSDGYDVGETRAVFEAMDCEFLSSVRGGVAWASSNDVNRAFSQAKARLRAQGTHTNRDIANDCSME